MPDPDRAEPSGAATLIPEICNGKEDAGVPAATVAWRFATTPEEKAVAFCPHKTHVTVPFPLSQSIVLPAAFAAAPAENVTLVMAEG